MRLQTPTQQPLAVPVSGTPAFSFQFLRALVVSGNSVYRSKLRDFVAGSGFEVEQVDSVPSALKMIRAEMPTFVVLCDDMTGQPGLDHLLTWLRSQGNAEAVHTLVICDTSNTGRVRLLLASGATDLIGFDFTETELQERLAIAEFRTRDLTQRMAESRQLRIEASRYRQIVHHWPQAAIMAPNLSRPIREVNERALKILGLSQDEVVGKYLSLILPELFERPGFVPYENFSKHPARYEDVVYEGLEGSCMLEVRIVGVEWETDGAVLVTFENLGRLKAMENQRSRVNHADSLRRFASEMAHEFNNILTVVGGNLGLLREMPGMPRESQPLVEMGVQACTRAGEIAKRLTNQQTKKELQLQRCSPLELVKEAKLQANLAPAWSIRVHPSDTTWDVRADQQQVLSLLVELIQNASEAMPDGGVIELEIDNVELGPTSSLPLPEGQFVRIAVTDDGQGIPNDLRDQIFNPFFTTRSWKQGLGLTRALEAAREHHGTLELEESSTSGACFALYLPGETSPVSPAMPADEILSYRPRVLFMDDESDIRHIVDRILSTHGFEVYCAQNGEEAVSAYYHSVDAGKPFDVLLLDLEVRGGMGGRETISILREEFPNIKAVVTTGYLEDGILANHREHGFSGVLTKPFQIKDLVSAMWALGGPTG